MNYSQKIQRLKDRRQGLYSRDGVYNFTEALSAATAYSARSRTPFRCDGGQHSTVMADTVPG